jgi:pilus assembly protein CpaD
MSNWRDSLRVAVLAATLLAGSCTSEEARLSSDGAENHPILVAPSNQSLRLPFSAPEAGLLPEDSARLEAFVGSYMSEGNGALSVSAPAGPDASAALSYFGERLVQMGVPRSRILVGTRDVGGDDRRVELSYVGYAAHTEACGDWSVNLATTYANDTAPNFGCAEQQNIAAMVANPRDLVAPQDMGTSDQTRRADVMGKYEKGDITQADKRKVDKANEQSGAASASGQN